MNITLYSAFQKKDNSTKQPGAGVSGAVVPGHLKEPTSVLHPAVRFQNNVLGNGINPDCTYAYIPDFHRYYFINDWTWDNGTWVAQMDVDLLASHKTAIGSKSEYILRTNSTTTNFNGAISDSMYPATTNFDIDQVNFSNPFVESLSQGVYIVGIINQTQTDTVGAITYYAMTSAQFGSLKSTLFSDVNLDIMGILDGSVTPAIPNIDDMSVELFRTMYNPYQYIASCIWFPITYESVPGDSVLEIALGWWKYSLSGKRLTSQVAFYNDGVSMIPTHPLASTRGKYLNYAPYTKLTLYGKFGSMPIDTSYLEIGSYLVNTYTVDLITGETIFEVFISDNSAGTGRKLINKTTFLLGTPIQIAQVGVDYLNTVATAVPAIQSAIGSAGIGAMLGGPTGAITGAIASGSTGIINALETAMPQLVTGGANGSFATSQISTVLIAIHFNIVNEDVTHRGRPLCAVRTINTLSGYVLCAEGDIDLDCYNEERDNIRRYLTTGFYWE